MCVYGELDNNLAKRNVAPDVNYAQSLRDDINSGIAKIRIQLMSLQLSLNVFWKNDLTGKLLQSDNLTETEKKALIRKKVEDNRNRLFSFFKKSDEGTSDIHNLKQLSSFRL
jgi:hypothetical protein